MAIGDPYASTGDVIAFLKATTVATNDVEMLAAVKAASSWIESYCRRQFNLDAEPTARLFDRSRSGVLLVDDIGDATFTVEADTSASGTYDAVGAGDVQVYPLNAIARGEPITELVRLNGAWPLSTGRVGLVRVTARWGWPAVPSTVHEACVIQAGRFYKRRESVEGVLGGGDFGVVRVGGRVDPDVEQLLAGVRRVGIG